MTISQRSGDGELGGIPRILRPETLDNHRALTSMQEELEAADWYDQRVDAATDQALKEILAHNRAHKDGKGSRKG